MRLPTFLHLLFLIAITLGSRAGPPGTDASGLGRVRQGPNLLFILADDMGWQDTSVAFGPQRTPWNDRYRTPALERLAREGMKFTQAYACTVCSPSRVSFLTGQNETRHGVTQWTYLGGDHPSSDLRHPSLSPAAWNWNGLQPAAGLAHAVASPALPMLLKQAGYRTMHFGKGHLGAAGTSGADPRVFGFDVRIGGRDAGGCGSYFGQENFGAKRNPKGPWRAWDLDRYFGQDIHLTEALTREASREIRATVARGQPFFCYFAHFAPHTPITPDERFAPRYRAAGLDATEAAYASLLEGLDKSVGDLLALLDELGVAQNTLVVFTSDNGGLSHAQRSLAPPHTHNAPLSSGKGAHHEGGIRVPLLVRWPGVTAPASTTAMPVMIYDWFPTLLRAAGVRPPEDIDGLDLAPLLRGAAARAEFDRPLLWHFPNFWGPLSDPAPVSGPGMGPSSTIRRGDWKLIYYHTDQRFELFDLAADLGETTNLAEREPARVRALAGELTEILQRRHAPMPVITATGRPVPWPAAAAGFGSTAEPAPPSPKRNATAPRLLLTRDGADYVVTSTATPTWKVVIAGTKEATNAQPGAGTIRALHLPATATESVVESAPGKFCCAGWGLDHLEWRYVDPGPPSKGIRAPSGTRAVTEKIELVRQTSDEITLRFTGHWQNVPRFTRTITLTPQGVAVRLEADWDGREGAHSMWWVMSLFRASWVEGAAVMVRDADTPAVPLPIARGQVFPLPNGIGFPYEVIFPLKQGPLRHLVLRVAQHGDATPAGLRYELWPEIDGYHMFYPRWVAKGFKQKTYVFDYAWRFDDAP